MILVPISRRRDPAIGGADTRAGAIRPRILNNPG